MSPVSEQFTARERNAQLFTDRCNELIKTLRESRDFWSNQIKSNPESARSACIELNRRVDARYILSDAENNWIARLSAKQRYEVWKEGRGEGGLGMGWLRGIVIVSWGGGTTRMSRNYASILTHPLLYITPRFSHEVYTLASAGTYTGTEVNVRARWDMLRVIKVAFLTFCEMEVVQGRPGVYLYLVPVGPSRYRIDKEVDRFPQEILNMAFFAPHQGRRLVTYEDSERELEDMEVAITEGRVGV
ncbi:hypothetical protein NMY22_g10096 [Coprinellus aureogranulatus]|nr:hypothetical protein NMY22_g10096 [Coprinellus aureogranulatus]